MSARASDENARKPARRAAKPKDGAAPAPRVKTRQSIAGGSTDTWQEQDNDTQFMKALARGLDILNAFKASEGPLGNAELAERTGLPAPTVSRLTYTLALCGYLSFNRRLRMYELGGAAFAIGRVALANVDVRRLAKPFMRELAARSGFNVGLGTRDRQSMIYTDACEGESLIGLRLFAGSRIPIATSAMGRAFLAALPEDELAEMLAELKPRYPNWDKVLKGIHQARTEVEKYGFCVSLGEWQKEIHGVAAPIRTHDTSRLFAINLGGPAYALKDERVWSELGPAVADIARKIETSMDV